MEGKSNTSKVFRLPFLAIMFIEFIVGLGLGIYTRYLKLGCIDFTEFSNSRLR